MIITGLDKTQFFYLISKDIKLKANGLLKSIKNFDKHQNLAIITIMKERGLLNINFLPEPWVKECRYCIALIWVQLVLCCNGKKSFDNWDFDNGSISLKIINSFLLLKAFSNPSCFVFLDITIKISLMLKSLLISKHILMLWALNKYPGTISQWCFILNFHGFSLSIYFG